MNNYSSSGDNLQHYNNYLTRQSDMNIVCRHATAVEEIKTNAYKHTGPLW